uniref:Uncharacterized protein n=1 Tax=Anguilla anguilla TaxID=7936 RepID=A0A0E9SZL7_ANGAN
MQMRHKYPVLPSLCLIQTPNAAPSPQQSDKALES